MGVGVVNCTSNVDSRLSELFCLSECLDCGAGQWGLDNQGWTVVGIITEEMHPYTFFIETPLLENK